MTLLHMCVNAHGGNQLYRDSKVQTAPPPPIRPALQGEEGSKRGRVALKNAILEVGTGDLGKIEAVRSDATPSASRFSNGIPRLDTGTIHFVHGHITMSRRQRTKVPLLPIQPTVKVPWNLVRTACLTLKAQSPFSVLLSELLRAIRVLVHVALHPPLPTYLTSTAQLDLDPSYPVPSSFFMLIGVVVGYTPITHNRFRSSSTLARAPRGGI
ncbi:hypothetical protein V8F33_008656 [Rhypophila sp. PSN 637]